MADNSSAPLRRAELRNRLLFTLGVLLIYRLGRQIYVPGLNIDALASLGGVLTSDMISIFALGLTPFFSALLVFELIKLIVPPLSRWETAAPRNAQRLSRIVYFIGLLMAGFQARGVADGFIGITGLTDGPEWEMPIAVTLVAGAALLCWLGEKATAYGLGNGFWLLVITPTLAAGLSLTARTLELMRAGAIQPNAVAAALVFMAVATALIVVTSKGGSASAENRVSGEGFASVWPPLIAATISGFVVSLFELQEGGTAHLALLVALIAAFNGLQWWGAASGTIRPFLAIVLVQIFVCAGAELLTQSQLLSVPINGAWLIVIVTTALSCLGAIGAQNSDPKPAG